MNNFTCDMCGKPLLLDEDVRYKVSIEVYAAYDPMELTDDDIYRDHGTQIDEICNRLSEIDEEELSDSVYKEIELDLCEACQRNYIKDPLFRGRRRLRFKENGN